jgi:hypothetical protein
MPIIKYMYNVLASEEDMKTILSISFYAYVFKTRLVAKYFEIRTQVRKIRPNDQEQRLLASISTLKVGV